MVVAQCGAQLVHVARRVLGADVRQQRAAALEARTQHHTERAAQVAAVDRGRATDAARVEARRRRTVAVNSSGNCGTSPHASSTPDPPGPPGFSTSEPMRRAGSVAAMRVTATSTVPESSTRR